MPIPCISEVTTKTIHMQAELIKNRQLKRFKLNYEYPARLQVAMHHQAASRIQALSDNSQGGGERCVCCDLPCQMRDISVFESFFQQEQYKEKDNNGIYTDNNVSILFFILKTTAIFYFLRSILTQILRWILLNQTKYCADNSSICQLQTFYQFISLPSLLYRHSQLLQMQVFISFIVIFVTILFFIIYRYFLFEQYDLISATSYHQEQYTLFVDNVSFVSVLQAQMGEEAINASLKVREKKEPSLQASFVDRAALKRTNNPQALIKQSLQLYFMSLAHKIKHRLEKKINQNANLDQLETRVYNRLITLSPQDLRENIVKEVVFCYDLTQISRLQEMIEKTMLEIEEDKEQNTYLDPNSLNYTPKRVKFLTQKLLNLQKNYCRSVTSELFLSRFLGCAFVSFQYSELKDYLLQFHQNNLKVFYDDTKFLQLHQAPAVQSVKWQNFKNSGVEYWRSQIQNLMIPSSLSIKFVFVVTLTQHLLNKIVFSSGVNVSTADTYYCYNALIGLIMVIFYNCLHKTNQIIGNRQTHSSQNTTTISRLIKSCITSILLIVGSIVIHSQICSSASTQKKSKIFFVFSFFLLFQTIYNFVPFSYLWLSMKQSKYKALETIYTFQVQLNRQLQLKQFDVVGVVLFQIITIFVISFFSHYVTFSAFSLGGVLLVNYWIFKYTLINFCGRPKRITRRLTEIIVSLFQFQLIMFAAGQYFSFITNASIITQDTASYYFSFGLSPKYFSLAQLIFAVLFKIVVVVWPKGIRINKQKKELSFSEAYSLFPYHYEIQSPATKFWSGQEIRTNNHLSFPFESYEDNELIKKKSTNVDKQLVQSGNIEIAKSYSMHKKKGSFGVPKSKNNLK